jgi:VanZ family protein
VSRSKYLLISWLPVVLCMGLIFGASMDSMSSERTSRYIGPVLRWLHPGISEQAIQRVQLGVRKCAHLTEYAILALLLYRAVRRTANSPPDRWCARCAAWALGLAFLYAISDEWHQSFVPSREGSVRDVLIDGVGAGLGLLLLYRWYFCLLYTSPSPRDH